MKTKIILWVLVVAALAGLILFIAKKNNVKTKADSGATSIYIEGNNKTNVGDSINATIKISNAQGKICAADVNLTFPADLLDAQSITEGPLFSIVAKKTFSAGTTTVTLGVPNCTSEDTTVYTVSFKAKGAGSAIISFSSADLLDSDGNSVTVSKSGLNINVNNPEKVTDTGTTSSSPTISGPSTSSTNTNNQSNDQPAKSSTQAPKTNTPPAASPSALTLPPPAIKNPSITQIVFAPNAVYKNNSNQYIVINGTAEPDSDLAIVILSNPINLTSKTDASGKWQATVDQWLDDGFHAISVKASRNHQESQSFVTTFSLDGKSKKVVLTDQKTNTAAATKTASKNRWLLNIVSGILVLLIAAAGFLFYRARRKYFH